MYRNKTINQLDTNDIQFINLLAIEVLEQLGIVKPQQYQVDAMESLLKALISEGQFITVETLSARESECLYWIAKGKTKQEIASILQLSPTTVNFHCANLLRKLNCQTIAQAVFEGMKYAYLNPSLTECSMQQQAHSCTVDKEISKHLQQEDQPDNLARIRYWLDQQKKLQKETETR